ncbi:APC family permease [Glaciibacter psychrotolerans]
MTTSVPSDGPDGLKKNVLGTSSIAFIVISAAAPLTIVAGIAPLAISIGGVGAPSAYLIAGVVLALFAIGFMAMTKQVKALGGFYSYITAALGTHAGLGAGLLAIVSYNALQIGLYGLLGVQASGALATFTGITVPWWVFALVGVGLIYLLGYRGIDVGAKVLVVLLTLETVIVAILAVAVLAAGGATGITVDSFAPGTVFTPGVAVILGFAFAAFMGFESTALYREEAKNPDQTVPRATYIAVGFMALFYAFAVWILVQAFGSADVQAIAGEHVADLAFVAMQQYVGDWGVALMYILIVTSIFASQLAFHNAINRYALALSRDGVLPARLGTLHPTQRSPYVAGSAQSVVAVVIIVVFAALNLDPYLQLLIWVNTPGVVGIIMLQALTSAAVIVFFLRNRGLTRRWYVVPSATLATLALLGVTLLVTSGMELLTGTSDLLFNGILVAIAPVTFVVGVIAAGRIKKRRPSAYARIGGLSND